MNGQKPPEISYDKTKNRISVLYYVCDTKEEGTVVAQLKEKKSITKENVSLQQQQQTNDYHFETNMSAFYFIYIEY